MVTASAPIRDDALPRAIQSALDAHGRPVLLAVSGGIDSMVLLDAAARLGRDRIAAVATFDHRSGSHSRIAVSLVRREGEARGLRVIVGRAAAPLRGEAAWRAARWEFLQRAAQDAGEAVATAHTRDDHLETVCMRVLRDAGARGLAGLLAPSPIVRPMVGVGRQDVEEYAREHQVPYVEDPTNTSRSHLRNRVRHDLLPAIARVSPGFAPALLSLSQEAAVLRRDVDAIAAALVARRTDGAVTLGRPVLAALDPDALALLVPAIAAIAGIILDRRGTRRLSAFILEGRAGGRVQLSGGSEAVLTRQSVIIRRERGAQLPDDEMPLGADLPASVWRFRQVRHASQSDAWCAALPAESRLTVRRWRPGDRMRAAGSRSARRVKRFLSDAGIEGPDRIGWPVVLADGEIVWIPGVRRSDAATDRSGRPVLRYLCERNDV